MFGSKRRKERKEAKNRQKKSVLKIGAVILAACFAVSFIGACSSDEKAGKADVSGASSNKSVAISAENKSDETEKVWKQDLKFSVSCDGWESSQGSIVVKVLFPNGKEKPYKVEPGTTEKIYDCEEGNYGFSVQVDKSDGNDRSYTADNVTVHFSEDNSGPVTLKVVVSQPEPKAEPQKSTRGDGGSSGEGANGGSAAVAAPPTVQPTPQPQTEPVNNYVINTNTGKFHIPSCRSVNQMKESNKWFYTGTRSSVIGKGYQPCGNCNP